MEGHKGGQEKPTFLQAPDKTIALERRLSVGDGLDLLVAEFLGQLTKTYDAKGDGQLAAQAVDAMSEFS